MTKEKEDNGTSSLSYLNISLPSGPSPSFIAEQNAAISFPLSSIVFFALLFFSPLYPISRPVTRSFCDSLFYFIRRKQGRIFSGDFVGRRDEEARRRRRRRQNSRRRRSRDRLLAEQARNITSSRANLELKNGAR